MAETPQPFDHLAARAREQPQGTFFHGLAQSMAYGDAFRYAKRLGALLRRVGVRPGDTVALDLPTGLHLLFLEALFHEAAVSCMVPAAGSSEHAFRADWLLSSRAAQSPLAQRTLLVDGAFLRRAEAEPADLPAHRFASPDSLCRIMFSSGTTGFPKPIAFTVGMVEFRSVVGPGVWMRNPPFLSLLDLGTVSGFLTFHASVMRGQPYLLPGKAAHNIDQINLHRVASIKASPAQIAELVHELETTRASVPSLRCIQFAGTSLPAKVAKAARRVTGARIGNLYGSTEAGTVTVREEDSDDPFDAGCLVEGSQLQIVDDDDRVLPAGSVGRIRYRRPFQAEGYYRDPEATALWFRDGWFYPGDNGSLGPDGRLTLAGRTSEIVNAGGVKIDPARVDALASTHPGVVDAAGFACEDATGMTEFVLAVVPGEGFDASSLVRALVTAFGSARPSTIVTVEQVPRNPMGKPLRSELARLYAESRRRR